MTNSSEHGRFALAVHGGAGTLQRDAMSAETEALYRAGLARALVAGRDILAAGERARRGYRGGVRT